jgi:hypothetical protein
VEQARDELNAMVQDTQQRRALALVLPEFFS